MDKEQKYTPMQTEILSAYKLVSQLSVSGDAVDAVAMIRIHLKNAYDLTEQEKDTQQEEETEHGG